MVKAGKNWVPKGKGTKVAAKVDRAGTAEVRFDSNQSAALALKKMKGVKLQGCQLDLRLDANSKDGTKLLIAGLPEGIEWQELKDHFAAIGDLAFVNIFGSKRHGPRKTAEVRFDTALEASNAMNMLQGAEMEGGGSITITKAPGSKDGTKLIVSNIPPGTNWGQVKDFFQDVGFNVAFSDIFEGGPSVGEVRYETAEAARAAMMSLNGTQIMGSTISIQPAPGSKDQTKLLVSGLGPAVAWQELKDHFGEAGTVVFCDVNSTAKGGKGAMMNMMEGGKGGMMGMNPMMGMVPMMGMNPMMDMNPMLAMMGTMMGMMGGKGGMMGGKGGKGCKGGMW